MTDFRIVDAHIHLEPWHQLRPEVREVLSHGRQDLPEIRKYIVDPDEFIAHLDEQGIARVAVINYPSPEVMGFGDEVNEAGAKYRDLHPDRIIAFGGMDVAKNHIDPEAYVEHLLDDLKLSGIKIHPPHQLVAPNAYLDGNDNLAPLYQLCQERKIPVMVHTGTSVFPGARGKFGDPMFCDDVAVDYPELPLILAHGGRPLWFDTAFHLVRRHPNVYMDLSGIPPKQLLIHFPRLEAIADKCLFGTDWPSPGVRSIRHNVELFLEQPLSDDARRLILAENADRLFPMAK